jgi:RNA polymerase primary sigma factor
MSDDDLISNDLMQQQSQLKLLIAKGKEQGYLTYAEVNDHLPDEIIDSDQIDEIISIINDMGISVFESTPDVDSLILGDTVVSEEDVQEAAAALASVESEIGRTTDPVRMYMREMGTVELLTREGEIQIAKRIEEGIEAILLALSKYPDSSRILLECYELVQKEEWKLGDLLSGFASTGDEPVDEELPPEMQDDDDDKPLAEIEDDGDDDDDDDAPLPDAGGPDPEKAAELMAQLFEKYTFADNALKTNGLTDKSTREALTELSSVFLELRLAPKVLEQIVENWNAKLFQFVSNGLACPKRTSSIRFPETKPIQNGWKK